MSESFLLHYLLKQELEHAEGDLYKVLDIDGETFHIYYGYYEDCDRENPVVEPMPIYPDFIKAPRYTRSGFPYVTKMQDACKHYKGKNLREKDCGECQYYKQQDGLLGNCTCEKNKIENETVLTYNQEEGK